MSEPDYKSKWWGYIYDQMMEHMPELVESNLRFYRSNLRNVSGPVLECACGTGMFLLPLLAAGGDMHGFDISEAMLSRLKVKAEAQGVADIADRISVQDFQTFHYDRRFAAIIIPTNSFAMLSTQEAQIRTLRNIYLHLAPEGRLLLDIRLAGVRDLIGGAGKIEGRWYTWTHPETGRPIKQRVDGELDFNNQLILDRCFIEYEGQSEEFPMTARWIFKEEFQLLLRLAGFEDWQCFSTPEQDPLEIGLDETQSYWIIHKPAR